MITALLCDVDGTLVDTNYLHTVCWWQAFSEADHRVPMAAIHRAIGMGADQLVPHLLDGRTDADLGARHNQLFGHYWPSLQPTSGAAALLRAVAQRGVRVVLASSAGADELAALRKAIDAAEAISGVAHADDVETSKPAPDLVHRALEVAGAGPAQAVFLGDTVWDIQAAHQAGVTCIAVTCGGISEAELRDAGAEEVYRDPAAVLEAYADSVLSRLT